MPRLARCNAAPFGPLLHGARDAVCLLPGRLDARQPTMVTNCTFSKRRKTMSTAITRFARDESGIAVTEYGLLIALIAVLLIAVVTIFGSSIASWFNAKTNTITSF
jgi:pilus assembly protein Flp/PilA